MRHEVDIQDEPCEECAEFGHAACDFCASILCEEHAKRVPGNQMLVACWYCLAGCKAGAPLKTKKEAA